MIQREILPTSDTFFVFSFANGASVCEMESHLLKRNKVLVSTLYIYIVLLHLKMYRIKYPLCRHVCSLGLQVTVVLLSVTPIMTMINYCDHIIFCWCLLQQPYINIQSINNSDCPVVTVFLIVA